MSRRWVLSQDQRSALRRVGRADQGLGLLEAREWPSVRGLVRRGLVSTEPTSILLAACEGAAKSLPAAVYRLTKTGREAFEMEVPQ